MTAQRRDHHRGHGPAAPALAAALWLLALARPAAAFSYLTTEDGRPLRWRADNPWVAAPYLPIAANPLNANGIYAEELRAAVIQGLVRWQDASGGQVLWDYWAGDDPVDFPAVIAHDGVSTIFFISASPEPPLLSMSTAAYTQLWFDDETATITEFDMVLNDAGFTFVPTAAEAQYGVGPGVRVAYLDDVITHELGHALGVGHSGVLTSSMFTWAWAEQSTLACDDVAAVHALYNPEAPPSGTGGLRGEVRDREGQPVFGAEVIAISADKARVEAAVITDINGAYAFEALPPGPVALMVAPFLASALALGDGYRRVDPFVCEGEAYARAVALRPDRVHVEPVEIFVGEQSLAPTLTVGCSLGGEAGMPVRGTGAGSTLETAFPVMQGGAASELLFERMDLGGVERVYRLDDFEGDLDMSVLSYSLFSPAYARPDLVDAAGDDVAAADVDSPVYAYACPDAGIGVQGEEPAPEDPNCTDFALWDTRLRARDLPRGTYYLRLRGSRLAEEDSPRGELYVDDTAFALIFLTRPSPDEAALSSEEAEALAAREAMCALDDRPVDYTSPAGPPLRRFTPEPLPEPLCGGCKDKNPWSRGQDTAAGAALVLGFVGWRRRRGPGALRSSAPRRG
jgi:hypothetical protein